MDFRIADTFTASLARLTGDEQKAAKTTAFDLQLNPVADAGNRFHRLERGKDKNFWSVRVSSDLRLIVHRTPSSLLLCYVDHHDKAYAWAERRKLETHPRTGAAQLVELRETVQQVFVPVHVRVPMVAEAAVEPVAGTRRPKAARAAAAAGPLFNRQSDDDLLGYGVPADWLGDIRTATEETLLTLTDHLPAEAAEALLELATGGKPRVAKPAATAAASPFDHPDAQRRFRTMANVEELERALAFPWDRWTVFLHPDQRQWVEGDYAGPARVSGSAGTGKTIVALHRAVHLARAHPDARVLLTTFSDALASALHTRLRRLLGSAGSNPRLAERIDVQALDAVALRLYRSQAGRAALADFDLVRALLEEASAAVAGHKFGPRFLLMEWEHVVDAWQLASWEAYRDVPRLGRRTRISEAQRQLLWAIFERVQAGLAERGVITTAALFTRLAAALGQSAHPAYDFVVVDEAQDLSVAQLRFPAALAAGRANGLFLAGDLGQRIFQQPFSWRALGVDIRGRSRALRVNYRTSHQIRTRADRLLAGELTDVDGNEETRRGTVSAFNGPAPVVRVLASEADEVGAVAEWLTARVEAGVLPHEIGVFVRSPAQVGRARAAVEKAGMPFTVLDERVETVSGRASIGTMHLAKGLEFRAVAVMACDDEVIPSQERIQAVGDEGDLQEVYDTERSLLYVACTRARDELLVTGVEPASEFLEDLEA